MTWTAIITIDAPDMVSEKYIKDWLAYQLNFTEGLHKENPMFNRPFIPETLNIKKNDSSSSR